MLAPWKKSYGKLRQHIKKQRHYFTIKGQYSQNYSFSSSHVWMWKLDHNEGWVPKNWLLQTVVLEKTFEHCLDHKEIKSVDTKGNQPWTFIGRTDAEAEPEREILWPPDMKSQFTGKDPDAGKDWGHKEKGRQRVRWLDRITDAMDVSLSKLWEVVKDRESWRAIVHGLTKSQTWLSDWTKMIIHHNQVELSWKARIV